MEKALRQWHPPFLNALQITLEQDREHYRLSRELELTRKPLRIDAMLERLDTECPFQKSIGTCFRTYNILEYKGYGDYLSINDYYKVLAYACLFRVERGQENTTFSSISNTDISLTLASHSYPRKLIHHLKTQLKKTVEEIENGIYWVKDTIFPTQILVLHQLDSKEYLWLKSLTPKLKKEDFELLARETFERKDDIYRDEVFEFLAETNPNLWKEVPKMNKIFEEIEKRGEQRGIALERHNTDRERRRAEAAEQRVLELERILAASGVSH